MRSDHSYSLRRRLLIGVMATVILGGLFSSLSSYHDSREQVEELFDAEMAQLARTLRSIFASHQDFRFAGHALSTSEPLIYEDPILDHDDDDDDDENGDDDEYSDLGHRYEKKLAFQIWQSPDRLLIQNRSATEMALSLQDKGFHDIQAPSGQWRVFTLEDSTNKRWIQVAQREDVRSELTLEIAFHSLIAPIIVLPIVALLVWVLIRQGLSPLESLSREVHRREPFDATPISAELTPNEVRPLIQALNALFRRVTQQADRQKQFTADAAHELRTPLAAMKINLQNARKRVVEERAIQSLDRSINSLNRLIRLVEQLLLLSRLDVEAESEKTQPESLNRTLSEVIDELQPLAESRQLSLRLRQSPEDGVVLNMVPGHLHSLLANLVSNAVKYTQEGGTVDVSRQGDQVTILDNGPGIAPEELERIFERFYRIGGDQSSGSGLGLSITERIVETYGFTIQIENRKDGETGLSVCVIFRSGKR